MNKYVSKELHRTNISKVLAHMSNFHIYPITNASKKHYRNFLRLNDRKSKISYKDLRDKNYSCVYVTGFKLQSVEISLWCDQTFGDGRWLRTWRYYWFLDDNDAVLFSLTWSQTVPIKIAHGEHDIAVADWFSCTFVPATENEIDLDRYEDGINWLEQHIEHPSIKRWGVRFFFKHREDCAAFILVWKHHELPTGGSD